MPAPIDSITVSLSGAITDRGTDPTVELGLTVRNDGDDPVTLRFPSGQRADFAAYRADTETESAWRDNTEHVWQHGAGRLFTQAMGTETLTPGETATYDGTWVDPSPGTYTVVGWLTTSAVGTDEDDMREHDADERDMTATATIEVK